MITSLKIAIDGRNLIRPLTGIARVICTTVEGLCLGGTQVHICLPGQMHSDFNYLRSLPNIYVHIDPAPSAFGRILWGRGLLKQRVKAIKADVFWAPAHRLSRIVAKELPTVLTVHDMVWKKAPETMLWYRRIGDKLLTKRAVKHANIVIAISKTTANDLAECFPKHAHKITVVPNIVHDLPKNNDPSKLINMGIKQPYILFVGTVSPRKNLVRTIKAFQSLPTDLRQKTQLVIAGERGWLSTDFNETVKADPDNIRVLGRVDEMELANLYEHCNFVVMPSLYEGFGYPIVEAQQFGKPVLTSSNTSMAEIGGKTATLIDPLNVSSINQAMQNLLASQQEPKNLVLAKQNAERFQSKKIMPILIKTFNKATNKNIYIP
jgi:glycosyltransferase involved in cell wall biosynthesis